MILPGLAQATWHRHADDVSDQRLRELEASWRASGSVEDEAAWLQERHRCGSLSRWRLEVAASCGSVAAAQALGESIRIIKVGELDHQITRVEDSNFLLRWAKQVFGDGIRRFLPESPDVPARWLREATTLAKLTAEEWERLIEDFEEFEEESDSESRWLGVIHALLHLRHDFSLAETQRFAVQVAKHTGWALREQEDLRPGPTPFMEWQLALLSEALLTEGEARS